MAVQYDENKPLYGGKGIDIYLRLLRLRYGYVDINDLLNYAQMELYQVNDEAHLFSQKQITLFYEKLVRLTGNKNIAREAGRFASSPEALGSMKGSILGMLGPIRYYELLGKFANKISKASIYEAHKLGPNKVEIIVTPYPGVKEEPFQCLNRMGYWEAISSVFHLKPPKILHPECLFKGDPVCRYIVSWKPSPANILKKIRNITALLLGLGCIFLPLKFPEIKFAIALPVSVAIVLAINWFARTLEIKDLYETVENLRDSSDKLMEQVGINNENSLLTNEIGQALAKELDTDGILVEIIDILQKRLDYDRGLVMLANADKSRLVFQAGYGYTDSQLAVLKKITFHLDKPKPKGIFAATFKKKKAILLNDIDEVKEDLTPRSYEFAKQMGVKSLISCPIIYEDESLGILAVDNIKSKRPLIQRDINLLMGIAPQIASRLHNVRVEVHLRQSQKMEAIGSLAGGVAHDFNNILTSVLGYSEILSTKLPEDDPLQYMVEEIHLAGKRAAGLTRQLLTFSRKQVTELKIANLNMIVEDMGKMLGRLIGDNVVMEMFTSKKIGNIMADVGQVEQILMNLVVNARDAMPNGGYLVVETGEIDLDEEYAKAHNGLQPGSYAMLTVTDNGEGMSRDVQERIFEPFFTTKEQGKGTGLGLSTVFGIVKKHHGHIYAYSEPGKGTTFKIYFPVVKGDVEKETLKKTTAMAKGTETILVADDDGTIRRLVIDTLEPLGYKLIEAVCGEDALEKCRARKGKIDLVLSDVVMPGLNGISMVKILKKECPDIKTVVMSGYADNVIINKDVLESDITFINKPLLPVSLANRLRSVLDGDNKKKTANT